MYPILVANVSFIQQKLNRHRFMYITILGQAKVILLSGGFTLTICTEYLILVDKFSLMH